ncbi:MAG: tyrosine-type recombinase/integrase [Oscillospiraceae bacterium]|nr:tyrosine-type recombinase/integrase [Oscillospiraceae bacterium]
MKIEHALKEYLLEIEVRRYTPRTIRSYRNNLNLFFRFATERLGIENVDEITLGTVKAYTKFLVGAGKASAYINSILKTVKSFTQYCYDEGYGGFNTKLAFKWCKVEKPVILTFTPEHVKKMLASCNGYDFLSIRDRAILSTLFETGIRCLELCSIQKEDIHDDYILINGKNHKQRVVPITPVLAKALMKYDMAAAKYFDLKNTDDFYFLSFHGRQLTNCAVEHIVKRHGDGIEGIRVSPHTCRHFFAQRHVQMGTDLYTISRLLGHENVKITQTYLNSLRDEDIINIAKQKSVLLSL